MKMVNIYDTIYNGITAMSLIGYKVQYGCVECMRKGGVFENILSREEMNELLKAYPL